VVLPFPQTPFQSINIQVSFAFYEGIEPSIPLPGYQFLSKAIPAYQNPSKRIFTGFLSNIQPEFIPQADISFHT
jgi:hypothetical protein